MTKGLHEQQVDCNAGANDQSDTFDVSANKPSTRECLAYMTQIVAELGTMASRAGLVRFATILGLAKDEAEREMSRQSNAAGNTLNPAP